MRRRTYRWHELSATTRRRIEHLAKLMQARDRMMRRVQRGWVPVRTPPPQPEGVH